MTSTNYCTNEQIMDWHMRTVWRYQLATMPANETNTLKKITNKIKRKSQKVQKQTFICENIAVNQTDMQELKIKKLTFSDEIIGFLPTSSGKQQTYINHVKFWESISQITLHITSGKLLSNIELYPSFYMAFCCFGNQGPQIIRSKRAVAEFNVIRGAIQGTRSNLQRQNKCYFLYKWAFISAGMPYKRHPFEGMTQCLGIHNIFIFPELDKYNYYLFEPIGGFDLSFNSKQN